VQGWPPDCLPLGFYDDAGKRSAARGEESFEFSVLSFEFMSFENGLRSLDFDLCSLKEELNLHQHAQRPKIEDPRSNHLNSKFKTHNS
jgi:hypothetical protein